MEVTFLGVGEACDEHQPNTSVLVRIRKKGITLLLDCGFSVPHRFFSHVADPEELDGIWISHFHGDHFFGLPLLLLRFREKDRRKPLVIFGQSGIEQIAGASMELAYPSFRKRLTYDLEFVTVPEGESFEGLGLSWRTAVNGHPQKDLAVRIEAEGKSLFYSGDGHPTESTGKLARGCDLVIQEAYQTGTPVHGHGTVEQAVDFAVQAKAKRLALVHVQRDVRTNEAEAIRQRLKEMGEPEGFLPEPGDRLTI